MALHRLQRSTGATNPPSEPQRQRGHGRDRRGSHGAGTANPDRSPRGPAPLPIRPGDLRCTAGQSVLRLARMARIIVASARFPERWHNHPVELPSLIHLRPEPCHEDDRRRRLFPHAFISRWGQRRHYWRPRRPRWRRDRFPPPYPLHDTSPSPRLSLSPLQRPATGCGGQRKLNRSSAKLHGFVDEQGRP